MASSCPIIPIGMSVRPRITNGLGKVVSKLNIWKPWWWSLEWGLFQERGCDFLFLSHSCCGDLDIFIRIIDVSQLGTSFMHVARYINLVFKSFTSIFFFQNVKTLFFPIIWPVFTISVKPKFRINSVPKKTWVNHKAHHSQQTRKIVYEMCCKNDHRNA